MNQIMRKIVAFVALFIIVSVAYSASVVIKKYRTANDFSTGKSTGITIRHDGKLTLAPKTESILQESVAQVWKLAKTKSGLYAATANPASVFRIDKNGDTTHVYSGNEAAIFALASDSKDRLYFSPSPGGHLYQYANNQLHKLATIEATYIWDILPFGDDLLVSTGIPGSILQISQAGQIDTLFTSNELHIRALAKDVTGTIYAGSSDNGLIYRFDRTQKPTILYDSPLNEIFALAPASDGSLWAAGAAEGAQLPGGHAPQITVADFAIESGGEGGDAAIVQTGGEAIAASVRRATKGKGMVYHISPNGFAKEKWDESLDRVQSLVIDADNNVLVGTGDDGKIYRLRDNGQIDMLLELKPSQITYLLADKAGTYIATSNLGSCFLLLNERVSSGEFTSKSIDAEFAATWGSLSWKSNGNVQFFTRSGNSEQPDNTWSTWSQPMQNGTGSAIAAPPARFLQWRAALKNGAASETSVSAIDIGYLPANLAPEISDITILDYGTAFLDAVEDGLRSNAIDQQQGRNGAENSRRGQSFGKKVTLPGFVSITWKASDPNKDDLQFDLLYQPVGAKDWRSLVKNYRNIVYSWDSRTMPDGEYLIKIVASDVLTNVPAKAQKSEKISEPLLVDNTAPNVVKLAVSGGSQATLTFEATDQASRITETFYAIDAGEWVLLYPQDGVSDSRNEQFQTALRNLARGSHTVMVKVSDENQNIQFAHIDFTL